MRILYGIFAQGHGHFSKAAVLVPLLQARGHEVRVVSSGAEEPPPGYDFPGYQHFPAFSYVVTDGKADYKKTSVKWLKDLGVVNRHLKSLRQLTREYRPDLIITDFEPLTANPLLRPGCEVVALSRQVALFDPAIPLPEERAFERKMTRSVVRLFTAGASRLFSYHYEPASYRCVPPIVRESFRNCATEDHGYVFVYNHYHMGDGGSAEELLAWSKKNQQPVKAYGFPMMPRGKEGLVEFCPYHRTQMPQDMINAHAIITTAGLTTPIEGFLLGKPTCTIPIPGNWEQLVNSFHLDHAGMAKWCRWWDYDALLDTPKPADDHPCYAWLSNTPEIILDCVLDEVTPGATGLRAVA